MDFTCTLITGSVTVERNSGTETLFYTQLGINERATHKNLLKYSRLKGFVGDFVRAQLYRDTRLHCRKNNNWQMLQTINTQVAGRLVNE